MCGNNLFPFQRTILYILVVMCMVDSLFFQNFTPFQRWTLIFLCWNAIK
jgi:hypothetical protein